MRKFLTSDGSEWGLPAEMDQRLRRVAPGVDAAREYEKIALWLDANPRRRKTPRGMPAFLLSWFDRSQNRARGPQGAQGSPEEAWLRGKAQ